MAAAVWRRLAMSRCGSGLHGREGVHILTDDAAALVDGETFVDGETGLPVDGLGVVPSPLNDDEGVDERGVCVGGEGHHLDGDIEPAGGPGDVAGAGHYGAG